MNQHKIQPPNTTYIIIPSNRLKDLKKWDLFKIDLGTSMYSIEDQNKKSKVDYIIAYHATEFDRVLQKLGNAGALLFYSDSRLFGENIQVVRNGELTNSEWTINLFIKDALIKLLKKAENITEPEPNTKNNKEIELQINNETTVSLDNNYKKDPEELKKRWLEIIGKNKKNIYYCFFYYTNE